MFENLLKEVKKLESVSVSIDTDSKGYVDKQCPSESCEFKFKVNKEDWKNIFEDEAVWCPLCRHEATSNQWFTKEQAQHAQNEAISVAEGVIHNAMKEDARKFNGRQNRKSFISMSLKVSGGKKRTIALPAAAAEEMQLEIQCESCSSRFAVIGSAYFCPACGHNSVEQTFLDSLRKISAKKDNIEVIRVSLEDEVGKDEAELICRSLLETCISDGVVAFQKLCEGLYEPHGKAPFNAFQRLEQSDELWKAVYGEGYSDWLGKRGLLDLNVLYQKRHLLAHNEGIVDDKYVAKSGDSAYKVGQRLVITIANIELLIESLNTLATKLLANRSNV
jgi:Zn finger protein HypA/HybF involved in hydrogenase expression